MFGFNFEFPYTNFHDLNMDWILRNIGMIWSKMVQTVNGIEPDDDGNVNVGTVKTVNGFSPDSNGEVKAGTVRSVNGVSPSSLPTPGSITLTPMDIGAVKTVNNTSPDAAGNVNLPTVAGVTSVDGIGADGSGNVPLGAVKSVDGVSPDGSGDVTIVTKATSTQLPNENITAETGVTNSYTRVNKRNCGVISLVSRFILATDIASETELLNGFPVPSGGFPVWLVAVKTDDNTVARVYINSSGTMTSQSAMLAGQYEVGGCYIIGTPEDMTIAAP